MGLNGRRQFLTGLGDGRGGGRSRRRRSPIRRPTSNGRSPRASPPALDLIYGGGETLAKALADLTDGHFKLKISPAGEIASAGEALDAVASGKADAAHTALSYAWSKDPSFIFATSTPFGMNARQHAAWLAEGGGGALIDELLADHKALAIPAGNTGGQMAGWFRKELRSVAGSAGPEDAGRRLRRQGVPDARRRARRDAARRRLQRAAKRLARHVRVGRPL